MGSSSASAECLRALLREETLEVVGVVTQPDRPVGRGKQLAPCPLAKYAQERGIAEIIKPEKVNDEEPMAQIRAWRPDSTCRRTGASTAISRFSPSTAARRP